MTSICNEVQGWARAQYTHGLGIRDWMGMSTTGLLSNTYMHSIAWAGQRPCAAMPSERRLGCQCSLGWYLPCFPLNSKLEFWVTFTQKLELQRAEKRFGADISLAVFSIQNLSKFHSQTSGSWKQTRVGYFAQTQGTSEGDGWDGQGNQNGLWFYINHICRMTLKIKVDGWNEKSETSQFCLLWRFPGA